MLSLCEALYTLVQSLDLLSILFYFWQYHSESIWIWKEQHKLSKPEKFNTCVSIFIAGHIFFFFTHRSQTVLKRVVVELCDNGFTHLNKRNLLAIYCLHCNHCIILLLLSRSYNTKNVITHNIILSFCQNKPSYTHCWVIMKLWGIQ